MRSSADSDSGSSRAIDKPALAGTEYDIGGRPGLGCTEERGGNPVASHVVVLVEAAADGNFWQHFGEPVAPMVKLVGNEIQPRMDIKRIARRHIRRKHVEREPHGFGHRRRRRGNGICADVGPTGWTEA